MADVQTVRKSRLEFKGFKDSFYMLDEVFDDGVYEIDGFKIEEGMNVIDIGANQGFFTVYAASMGANVLAFEPDKENFEILEWNVRSNGLSEKVKLSNIAVSDSDGMIWLYSPVDCRYRTAVVSTSEGFVNETRKLWYTDGYRRSAVRSITLDSVIRKHKINVCDLLKIDCEGAEYDILKGASVSSLNAIKRLVMETHLGYGQEELVRIVSENFKIIFFSDREKNDYGNGYVKAVNRSLSNQG